MVLREVIAGARMDFLVLGRAEIARTAPEAPHLVISITEPDAPEAKIAHAPACLGVLRLQFHDADRPEFGRRLLSEEDAQAVVQFVQGHGEAVRLIVCQCEGGISRSAGIAAALSRWLQDEDAAFFRHYQPNSHVYRAILQAVSKENPKR